MRKNRAFSVFAALLVALLSVSLIGCGGGSKSNSDNSTAAEEKAPQSNVKNRTDVDEIEVVSVDEGGITLSLTQTHDNLMLLPLSFEVAGNEYSLLGADDNLNPQVHFRVDDSEEDNFSVDIKNGETHQVRISIDGVTDYTHFKMNVDNTIYHDDGEAFPIRDVSVEVVTE